MKGKRIFVIIIGLVATIGFCFTPALAKMDNPMSSIESEDDLMVEEPGEDFEILDGKFGEGIQNTWVPISSFKPVSSNTSFAYSNGYSYFLNLSNPKLIASINLPSGAYLYQAQFHFYDYADGSAFCSIYRNSYPTSHTLLGYYSSSGSPGHSGDWINLDHTIRNSDGYYTVIISTNQATYNLRVGGLKLMWKRQISPAPASASFSDVPTNHPFFREIEALASSGITTGFSDGTYRPSIAVTRQAMAAFLSRALGLHWDYPY